MPTTDVPSGPIAYTSAPTPAPRLTRPKPPLGERIVLHWGRSVATMLVRRVERSVAASRQSPSTYVMRPSKLPLAGSGRAASEPSSGPVVVADACVVASGPVVGGSSWSPFSPPPMTLEASDNPATPATTTTARTPTRRPLRVPASILRGAYPGRVPTRAREGRGHGGADRRLP